MYIYRLLPCPGHSATLNVSFPNHFRSSSKIKASPYTLHFTLLLHPLLSNPTIMRPPQLILRPHDPLLLHPLTLHSTILIYCVPLLSTRDPPLLHPLYGILSNPHTRCGTHLRVPRVIWRSLFFSLCRIIRFHHPLSHPQHTKH